MDYRKWDTLLELKEHTPILGLKGMIFFIVDFPRDLEGNLKFMIAQPTVTGFGVGVGTSSFVLSTEELEKYFTPLEKSLKEYSNNEI